MYVIKPVQRLVYKLLHEKEHMLFTTDYGNNALKHYSL